MVKSPTWKFIIQQMNFFLAQLFVSKNIFTQLNNSLKFYSVEQQIQIMEDNVFETNKYRQAILLCLLSPFFINYLVYIWKINKKT
jgi:hypothetical protein